MKTDILFREAAFEQIRRFGMINKIINTKKEATTAVPLPQFEIGLMFTSHISSEDALKVEKLNIKRDIIKPAFEARGING